MEGSSATLFEKLMFYIKTFACEDVINIEFDCTKIGTDKQSDIETEKERRIYEAVARLLPEEKGTVNHVLYKHSSVVRMRLGNDGPTNKTPNTVQVDNSKSPVIVTLRRYPAELHNLVKIYFDKLPEIGYKKQNSRPHGRLRKI